MKTLDKHWSLPMPKRDERSQCREFVESVLENDTIHVGILESYRSAKVKMDETLPGVKDLVRWQSNNVVSLNK